MKTMHVQTSHFIRHTGNMVDLDEYRRKSELARRNGLTREAEEELQVQEDTPGFQPVVLDMSPAERRSARRERRAWYLDACASLAVVFMMLVFALRVLL